MQHDPRAFLWDVLRAADWIAAFLQGHGLSTYLSDPLRRSAVERQLEIVGEALGPSCAWAKSGPGTVGHCDRADRSAPPEGPCVLMAGNAHRNTVPNGVVTTGRNRGPVMGVPVAAKLRVAAPRVVAAPLHGAFAASARALPGGFLHGFGKGHRRLLVQTEPA